MFFGNNRFFKWFLCLCCSVTLFSRISQAQEIMNAEESDPRSIGFMEGFPPPEDKLIMQPESDFFSFPKLRWTVCHIRELMPTEEVSRGIGSPLLFEYAINDRIDSLKFTPFNSSETMTWAESLAANYTDGILILHKGKIIYEKYSGCLDET